MTDSICSSGSPASSIGALASGRTIPWVQGIVATLGLCLAAQARFPIPGTDVPATLQSLAVLLIGLTLRPQVAFWATLGYLVIGFLGAPVFASATGLLGSTGGYLFGFVLAATVISVTRTRSRSSTYFRLVCAGALGLTVLFACGVSWRVAWLGMDWSAAALTGVAPFMVKALVELFLAAGAALMMSRRA